MALVLATLIFATFAAAAPEGPAASATIQVIELAPRLPEGAIRAPATATPARLWGVPADYPALAIAARQEGRIFVTVSVSANDAATDCAVVRSEALSTLDSSYRTNGTPAGAELQQAACAIALRRGAYRHGLSPDGTALPGLVPLIVNFLLTDPRGSLYFSPAPMAPRSTSSAATFRNPEAGVLRGLDPAHFPEREPRALVSISERGEPLGCSILTSSGTDLGDVAVCRHLMSISYVPARDEQGSRVAAPRTVLRLSVIPA